MTNNSHETENYPSRMTKPPGDSERVSYAQQLEENFRQFEVSCEMIIAITQKFIDKIDDQDIPTDVPAPEEK